MIHNKKGAVELSITTIVVVVIGITLLALGLAWVSGVFERLQATSSGAFEKADAEIGEILTGSAQDEPFSISPTGVTLAQGKSGRATAVVSHIFKGTPSISVVIKKINPGSTPDPEDQLLVEAGDNTLGARQRVSNDRVSSVRCALGDTLGVSSKTYILNNGQEARIPIYIEIDRGAALGTYYCNFQNDQITLSSGTAAAQVRDIQIEVTK